MKSVVRGQLRDDLDQLVPESPRFAEPTHGIRRRDCRQVEVVHEIGVIQLVAQTEAARLELVRGIEVASSKGGHAERVACRRL